MSSASVTEISPVSNLAHFFETIYGTQTGYVYAPIKELKIRPGEKKERFKKRFFQWPEEKNKLIDHVLKSTENHEVYYSPSLWNSPATGDEKITEEHFKGTYYVWTDFDYGLPKKEQLENLPEPTIRIQSSERGKEHWYWRLDFFNDNKEVLETFTKKLTYALDADLSGWDYTQVLRPPGTNHHKSGKKTRIVSLNTTSRITIQQLALLPEIPKDVDYVDINVAPTDLPDINEVVFKYSWPHDTADLFRKKLSELNIREGRTKPDRSGAIMRLGYDCAQMGMSNSEIYSVITHVDKRWKKFVYDENPHKAYVRIINKARHRYPTTASGDIEAEIPVFGFKDFLNTKINMEWVIDGLLQRNGILVLSSPPGLGKTQWSVWVAAHIALGKEIFGWKVRTPLKIMFYSMEMGHEDLKYISDQMAENFTEEELLILNDNLLIIPLGYSILLDKYANQVKVLEKMEEFRPDGVMFDSLGVAIGDDISSDTVINNTFNFLKKELITRYGSFVWFIHHNRKPQANNQKPKKLEDLYGSQYIGSNATTVVGLWPSGSAIEVNCLKLRLGKHFSTFKIDRTDPLGFKIQEDTFVTMSKGLAANNGSQEDGGNASADFGLE